MTSDDNKPASMAESVEYAGFGPRVSAFVLDAVLTLPVAILPAAAIHTHRFGQYSYWLIFVFQMFYEVYLVRRFGGTPGKLIMNIRITRADGRPITYREALLRAGFDLIFVWLSCFAMTSGLLRVNEGQFATLSIMNRIALAESSSPFWQGWIAVASNVWICGEFIVLFTNEKKRGLQDFLAGTVVIIRPQRS